MPTFGERFKELRLNKKMKQEELINDFNKKFHYSFTKSAVSQYENDKRIPEIQALNDFAEYFDVSVDYLLGKTDINIRKVANAFVGAGGISLDFELSKFKDKYDKETINKTKEIINAFTKKGIDINSISIDEIDKIIEMYLIMKNIRKD